jgi:hypothetical protein
MRLCAFALLLLLAMGIAEGFVVSRMRPRTSQTRIFSSATPNDPQTPKDGEFRIQPKDAVDAFLGGDDDVDPAFQGRRRSPAPLSDNVTVLVGTVGLLAAVIGAFLFSNRDIPPFPVTH